MVWYGGHGKIISVESGYVVAWRFRHGQVWQG